MDILEVAAAGCVSLLPFTKDHDMDTVVKQLREAESVRRVLDQLPKQSHDNHGFYISN